MRSILGHLPCLDLTRPAFHLLLSSARAACKSNRQLDRSPLSEPDQPGAGMIKVNVEVRWSQRKAVAVARWTGTRRQSPVCHGLPYILYFQESLLRPTSTAHPKPETEVILAGPLIHSVMDCPPPLAGAHSFLLSQCTSSHI